MKLVPATLALTGACALVLAGMAGVALAPLQTAEAATVLRLDEAPEVTTAEGTTFDAAAKSELLKAGSETSKAKTASATKTATEVPSAAKRTTTRTTTVSRSSSASGWNTARVSWYGPGFYGNTMAGGGTLTPTSMVVAHRSLAFGTRVEFKYNGKTCVAVVQDRGPYVSGRTFDLGPGTAKALGFSGVGTVSYRILGR